MGVIEVIEPALLDEAGHRFEAGGLVRFVQIPQDFCHSLNHQNLLPTSRYTSFLGQATEIDQAPDGCFIMASWRLLISSTDRSSLWVAMVQTWPNGSSKVPERSP